MKHKIACKKLGRIASVLLVVGTLVGTGIASELQGHQVAHSNWGDGIVAPNGHLMATSNWGDGAVRPSTSNWGD